MADRERSRSPRRRDHGDRDRPKKTGGLRWKEKRRDDESRGDDRRLDRGYRDRSDRPRSPRRDRDGERSGDRYRDGPREHESRRCDAPRDDREKKVEKKEKKEKKPAMPQSSEPMIVVHVNDRLGTKAAIPCLASDPISESEQRPNVIVFDMIRVAARIGREPHEILLKRQGERPFKDQLTLEDYGVSNGVQLDLEVGTGD
ncbi:hypothetical protein N7539_001630 [Penicillium diatomitis]|uniref:Ubiquitin-like modifier HUB1 n=1 Tax=Penicillium diatomitis TaxID=2819901 RepID=A0A9W9XHB3_9EURO|nr:uncharacterized protein N7539_001630 [Penicillium diatomitis]KAJ5492884.1 hypothetical protein N7539_001630 [Penicillium diatomitis]